ncbi:MAG: histidine kinase [Rubrivivax sp.]|nr:histidine kinase [Rubrivivax sp.]
MSPPKRPRPDFPPTAGRDESLWPQTAQPPGAPTTSFAATRFDPLAEDRARSQAQTAAAFDVCHPALALRAVLVVQAVLAVAALVMATSLADWGPRQAAHALAGITGTGLWLIGVCALRPLLRQRQASARAALVIGLGALTALLGWLPLWAVELADAAGGLRVVGVLCSGGGLAALIWAWLEMRARIWHPVDAQARLAELQSRIRPHFLFNALNTALALVRVDPARAEGVLEDLAELFRVALAEPGSSVSLADEVDLARRYLAIEQVRFGPRLQLSWDIDPKAGGARVPPLVLQPLVENAVRHGVEPAVGGGRVAVQTVARRGQVVVTISNTVPDEPPNPGHGMALANVRERLRLLHDVAAQCEVWREADSFHVRIVLPLT